MDNVQNFLTILEMIIDNKYPNNSNSDYNTSLSAAQTFSSLSKLPNQKYPLPLVLFHMFFNNLIINCSVWADFSSTKSVFKTLGQPICRVQNVHLYHWVVNKWSSTPKTCYALLTVTPVGHYIYFLIKIMFGELIQQRLLKK